MNAQTFRSPYIEPGLVNPTTLNFSDEQVVKFVALYFKVDLAELESTSRKPELVIARHYICYILRKHKGREWKRIGDLFNRDHATAINGVRKMEDYLSIYPSFRADLNNIMERLSLIETVKRPLNKLSFN